MDIIRLTYPFQQQPEATKQVLAIGYFDGVHVGHRQVIGKTRDIAKRGNMPAAIMTFDPHPREVLGGGKQHPQYITPLAEKLEQFAKTGVERTYILTFNLTLSRLTPEQFVHEVLFALQVDTVVVGFNFTYGHLGRGTVDMLREYGGDRMKVNIVRPFLVDGVRVSSTIVRELLLAGKPENAAHSLGRPFSITGQVIKGQGRGSTIGIPTANIQPAEPFLVPKTGVYAVRATHRGTVYDGVMNIGFKPTFDDNEPEPVLEAHLFGLSSSIYGDTVKVDFIAYLREETRFASVDALVGQIHADIAEAKRILAFTS